MFPPTNDDLPCSPVLSRYYTMICQKKEYL